MSTETSRAALPSRPATRGSRRVPLPVRAWLRGVPAALRAGYWAEIGIVAALLVSLAVVRLQLLPWQSGDYTMFLVHWFDYLHYNGFQGLGDEFANYNMPYLYLMYLGSLVSNSGLAVVKGIGALSDVALALGAFAVLRTLRVPRELALVGGVAVLLLPEVLLNSAAWGQADSTYGALLVWALWAALRDRQRTTWILFALAFTFKLQAAFVLPAFVILHVTRRWGWQGPALALLAVIATEIPALVAGRSIGSLASIYIEQTTTAATLTMNAPSLYALLPEGYHDLIKSAGMYFALASVALLSWIVLRAARRRPLDGSSLLLFVTALATIAPFTLPLMHERYFYVANVLLFAYALVTRRLLAWAFVAQLVAVSAYSPFLFGIGPVQSMGMLAIAEGAVLFVVVRELVRVTDAFPARTPEPTPAI